jgi:muramidase (phage lysozyme)
VQEVVKSLGQDAVIATNGLNDAFKGLGDTVMGVGTKLDVTLGKLNQVTNENNSSDWAGNLLNTVGRVFGGITSAVSSAITPPTAQDAVATTPATPAPTVTPTVATQFTSPIKNTTIQDLINYKPTFGQSVMGRRPKGRIHNKVDFDSQVKGGAGAEVIASLAGVAKLQKWGGQDAAVFVNSILPSGTQITIEYGHLALNSIKNTLGDLSKPVQVQAGQKLGNVLGHHLDFGVKANGRYINPQVFLANLAKGDYGAIASQPPATAKTKANTVTPANQSKGESVIRMQRLGQKDEFGLEKIQLAVIKQGKIVDRFIVNSGKADTQIFGGAGETKAGAKQPVEFGSYRLGKTTPSGNKAKMGNEFIRLEPDFKTERTAIGFHIDKDRLVDPGSSGCIVFANEAEFNKFKQALKSTGIKSFVFDQSVGAVEIAKNVASQVKPLPKRQPVPILPPVPGTIGIKNSSGISQGGNDLSSEEYAKLTPLGKQLYELRKNKYILALANAVANAEGSDFRKNTENFGYGLTIGGENVTDFSKHPYVGTGRKPTWIKWINNSSTAAGRYQMMDFNASIQAAKKQFGKNAMPDMFKLTDYQGQDQPSFSPGIQDLYFILSLKSRGVLDQVLAGKVDTSVLNKLALHYASIQSGKNRSAYKGQGTPQGQHSNFLKTYQENLKILNSAQMSGSAIDPNALQTSLTEAGGLSALSALLRNRTQKNTTEAQQLQKVQNAQSSVNKLFLETEKGSRSTKASIVESQLNTQGFILDNRFGVPPTQRIPLELGRFRLDITKRINELQDIISETGGVTLESLKIKLAPMFEEAAKLGIEIDPQKVEALYQETFKINQLRHEQAKKQLKELISVRDSLTQDKETFLNNQEQVRQTGVGLQTEKLQVGLLQKQIEQRKLLQQLNPLDPRSAKTADLEANLALKNADVDYREKLNSILSEEGKSLSVEEAQKRRNLAKEEFETTKQNIELKRRSDNITEDSAMPSRLLERAQFIQDSFKGVQESRSSLLKAYGLDFRAEKIDKQLAINNQQMDFAKATLQLDDFIRKNAEATEANKLTNEQINTLRENLKLTNEAKLDAIKLQFSELGTVVKGVTSSFRGGFKEFLLSTKGFGESVSDLFNSIMKGFLDPLADIASKRMTDALFGWTEGLFGNKKQPTDGINAVPGLADLSVGANGLNLAGMTLNQAGQMLMQAALTISNQSLASTAVDAGGGLLGGIFDVLSGSVFNANSMGFNPTPGLFDAIPTVFGSATLPMFADGGIVGVMNKERSITGRKPHLIVASEGERVLNHKETAIWNKLQSGVAGFANGGVVGAGGNGSMASKIGNTTTINVPVSVEVGSDSEVDTYRLSQAVQAMVSDGIRREMRVGGSIHRGNPYGR